MTADEKSPAHPRPASTVVLLRDSAAGPETLLLRRNKALAFAGAASAGMAAWEHLVAGLLHQSEAVWLPAYVPERRLHAR